MQDDPVCRRQRSEIGTVREDTNVLDRVVR
jgi:hypothetical protein